MAATDKKDYYGILGVKKTATADEVRKAFRKLARKYHPTSIPVTKSLKRSSRTSLRPTKFLSDPKKRKIYDQLGFYSDNIDPKAAEAYADGRRPARRRPFGGAGGNPFGGYSAGGGGQQHADFDFQRFRFRRSPAVRRTWRQLPRHLLRHVWRRCRAGTSQRCGH